MAVRRPLDPSIASQLVRTAASVSANIGEGYSRPTRADRLRFLSYGLGSTREFVSWYEASLGAIDRHTLDLRLTLRERNRAPLLGLILPRTRSSSPDPYGATFVAGCCAGTSFQFKMELKIMLNSP